MTVHRLTSAALCMLLAVACSSNGVGQSSFPFAGPSCSAVTSDCWQCTQESCTDDVKCMTSTCVDYWSCQCACASTDGACIAACQPRITSACAACRRDVGSCEALNCSSCDSAGAFSPVAALLCGPVQTCSNGLSLEECWYGTIGPSSSCTTAYYMVGQTEFPCASCLPSDLQACKAQATQACGLGPRDQ